jgi:phage terminase small subunit
MDLNVISEHLKRPPEHVRLREMYPELPDPIPFAEAGPLGPWNEYDQHPPELRRCFYICFPLLPEPQMRSYAVTAEHYRIVEEYEDARERQGVAEAACAGARWENRSPDGEPREPAPEAIPPRGELTSRQEEFCRHYATQPVGARAAILAGYSEENAAPYGSRLLKNPLVLDRIARLRAEKHLHYVVERDTVHDKLEAVFFEALGERNHAAAVAALRLQANLAGILTRAAPNPEASADAKANKSQGAAAKKPRKAKAGPRRKPRKAKAAGAQRPRKAKQSQ